MELKNKKITEADFFKEREQVLASWHTGKDPALDFSVSLEYLRKIPEEKISP